MLVVGIILNIFVPHTFCGTFLKLFEMGVILWN